MSANNFKSSIDRIRDVLRLGKRSITGMDSMKHITIYLVHRYINKKICLKLGIPEALAWDNIYNHCLNDESYWAISLDHLRGRIDEPLIEYIDEIFGTRGYTFLVESVPKHKEIMQIINTIEINEVHLEIDLIGYLFEIHLKNAGANKRDLGQFFTDRSITKFMVELCQPGIKNGMIETMCDSSMGSGGFLTSYVQYYNENYDNISWKKQQKNIYGCDVDEFITALSKINLLFESGGVLFDNLQLRDSLADDITDTPELKFNIILTNVPFGLKGLKYDNMCQSLQEFRIKNSKAVVSEPAFLQLIMKSLNYGGRCAVIVPDGILFASNPTTIKTRQYLLNNFNIHKIIKMEGKFFMNTGLEPSILFFSNDGNYTKDINFTKIYRNTEGLEEEKILSIPRNQLDKNDSLYYKRYLNIESEINTNYPTKEIKDILHRIKGGPSHKVADGKKEGLYPLIRSSATGKRAFLDSYDHEELSLVVGTGGAPNVHLVEKFSISTHNEIYRSMTEDVLIEYVYYYLKFNLDSFKLLFKGSGINNISAKDIATLKIPIPPKDIQKIIIKDLMAIENEDLGLRELLKDKLDLEDDFNDKIFKEDFINLLMLRKLQKHLK